jgi:hypothetical protein
VLLLPLLSPALDPIGWLVRTIALPILRVIFELTGHGVVR